MMAPALPDLLGLLLIALGAVFFVAGSVGLLRFPDLFCRLHALTKADGLGLALVCAGAAVMAASWAEGLRLVLIWALVALSGATCSHLVAALARASGDARGKGGGDD